MRSLPQEHCRLCGSGARAEAGMRALHGQPACARCRRSFLLRRGLAFIADVVIAGVFTWSALVVLVVAARALLGRSGLVDTVAATAAVLLGLCLFLVKDGLLEGRSPGKALTGLRVVRAGGEAVPLTAAAHRTWFLLIPGMQALVLRQACEGDRLGDRRAGTRVVWERYADRPPFRRTGPLPGASGLSR